MVAVVAVAHRRSSAPGRARRPRRRPTPGPVALVVDDNDGIRALLAAALADEGYTVEVAIDGVAALACVAARPPAVILLDWRMAGGDGATFLRRYHAGPGPHAPVVGIAASRLGTEALAAAGADTVLDKPFDLDDLLATVARYAPPREPR